MTGTDAARWDLVATERLALADLLEGLTPAQWAAPSLCEGWSVREVAAHVMVGPTSSTRELARAMVTARGNPDRANTVLARARATAPTEHLVQVLREHAGSRFSPPLMDWHAPLTDVLLHREDVAVPLGLPPDRPVQSWLLALEFLVSRRARTGFVGRGLPKVRLRAADADWQHGEGPEVAAPATALALVLTGRTALLDRLVGDGAAALSGWVSSTRR